MSDPTTSPRFTFISGDDFRTSLESDYGELERALAAKAWKTVYILAGSIIEAVLIDYLVSLGPPQVTVDPLTLDLAKAIDLSLKLKIVSDKTAHLCHAVRHYRNLIHPGRSVRLGERADGPGAQVAFALVLVVLSDVEARRKAVYGYTAEQIATKLESDSSALPILSHLLKDTNQNEQERLLLDVLPTRYFALLEDEFTPEQATRSLRQCFRTAFAAATEHTKKKVLQKFARVLKEENQHVVLNYERAFFCCSDLAYATPADKALIKQHVFSRAEREGFDALADVLAGIEEHLDSEDLSAVVDVVVQSVLRKPVEARAVARAKSFLYGVSLMTTEEQDKVTYRRLDEWIRQCETRGSATAVAAVKELKESLLDVPF